MYINKLRIQNYKSFLDSGEINFKHDIFAFIGQNNTGKSAILDAIQTFFPKCKKNISPNDYHKGTGEDIIIEIWFKGATPEYLESTLYKDKIQKQYEKINEIKNTYAEDKDSKTLKELERQREKLNEIRDREYKTALEKYGIEYDELYIKMIATKGNRITKKHYNKQGEELKDADLNKILPEVRVIPALRDPKAESTAGNNSYLKELIQMLDEESKTNIELNGKSLSYSELNEVLSEETKKRCEKLANKITYFYNEAVGRKEFKIDIASTVNISKGTDYFTTITDTITNISNDILDCGTGYQSMIILSILETYVQISESKVKYILLIEEPEVYLHPELQRRMIDTLIRISKDNQVVFTSHSPITVSNLSDKNIKLVEKENGQARVSSICPKKVIDELGIKPDDILFHKGIIFVEGKDDYEVVTSLIEKIESSMVDKINVIQTHSCQNLKFYANAELLMNINFDVPVLVLRDADTKEPEFQKEKLCDEITDTLFKEPQYLKMDKEELEMKKEKLKDSIYVLSNHSMEYYFIEKNYLSEFCLEEEKLEYAIKCYKCQYEKQLSETLSKGGQYNNFEKFFQPKRFLRGHPDRKERDRKFAEESFVKRWKGLSESCQCDNKYKIDNFLNVREEIIKNINELYVNGDSYIKYIIQNNELEVLKEGNLKEVIELIETFVRKVKG